MKPKEDVISDFNHVVNMSASELETWLESNDSTGAGWPKDDGSGESVGHDSGRKIVQILKANPNKEPEMYTDEDVEHMRKVVAYCKRHLAQETKANNEKTPDEIKKTKSYASLKNWGHDFVKAQGKEASGGDKHDETSKETRMKETRKGGHDGEKSKHEKRRGLRSNGDENAPVDKDDENEGHAGTKRKPSDKDAKPSKKRETHKGHDGGKSGESDLAMGDTVSWKWGGGHPQGKVLDVKGEKTSILSKNDHKITRKGTPDDPAVVLDAGKSKAIKLVHELD